MARKNKTKRCKRGKKVARLCNDTAVLKTDTPEYQDEQSDRESIVPTLQTLPPELHLKIFDYLRDVNSACLGLTCKQFYGIHWELHGKVSLEAKTHFRHRAFTLHAALKDWMPGELEYYGPEEKFLTKWRRQVMHVIYRKEGIAWRAMMMDDASWERYCEDQEREFAELGRRMEEMERHLEELEENVNRLLDT
ncbi:hypothetical protein LAWI1_G008309 [Lachnellula willkommii]|uniref:F-box domain-containing protein n=1 Tax=Lachnellula willkommii TaxID=215461 RepID=A0A559LYQ1_9HELO|nr:hypothetical protein LAWI1_G008309 [Lachnellula willkommii]